MSSKITRMTGVLLPAQGRAIGWRELQCLGHKFRSILLILNAGQFQVPSAGFLEWLV